MEHLRLQLVRSHVKDFCVAAMQINLRVHGSSLCLAGVSSSPLLDVYGTFVLCRRMGADPSSSIAGRSRMCVC